VRLSARAIQASESPAGHPGRVFHLFARYHGRARGSVIKPSGMLNRFQNGRDYKKKTGWGLMKPLLMVALFIPFFVLTLRGTRDRLVSQRIKDRR
jgi:hypothetical protein